MKEIAEKRNLLVLGPQGSFSDQAAQKIVKRQMEIIYARSFAALFAALTSRPSSYALIPVKNKLIGEIAPVAEFLKKHHVEVRKRFRIPVSFVLAAKNMTSLEALTDVYVPQVARAQCKKFLAKKVKHTRIHTDLDSTSAACKKVARLKSQKAAAIGSAYAAKLYNLKILARGLEDQRGDWTEFILCTASGKATKAK